MWTTDISDSMHTLTLAGFMVVSTLLIHGVGSCTFVIIPCFVSSSNLLFSRCFIATGIRGTCCSGSQHPLLSVTTCTELGLITVHSICNVSTNSANLIKQYSDVFEGLGCLGDEYHIELDPVRTKCPTYGKTCRHCIKSNHFHTVCLRVDRQKQ